MDKNAKLSESLASLNAVLAAALTGAPAPTPAPAAPPAPAPAPTVTAPAPTAEMAAQAAMPMASDLVWARSKDGGSVPMHLWTPLGRAGFYGHQGEFYGLGSAVERLNERDPSAFRALSFRTPTAKLPSGVLDEIRNADSKGEATRAKESAQKATEITRSSAERTPFIDAVQESMNREYKAHERDYAVAFTEFYGHGETGQEPEWSGVTLGDAAKIRARVKTAFNQASANAATAEREAVKKAKEEAMVAPMGGNFAGPMTQEQKDKLARLKNRPTSYEYTLTEPNGKRWLVLYFNSTSERGLVDVLRDKAESLAMHFAIPPEGVWRKVKTGERGVFRLEATTPAGVYVLKRTGRTERDAIQTGEHPHISKAPTIADKEGKLLASGAAAATTAQPAPSAPVTTPAPANAEEQKFIMWALPAGSNDRMDEKPLVSFPITLAEVEKVKAASAKDGWHGFRVVPEKGEVPDFTKAIEKRPTDSPKIMWVQTKDGYNAPMKFWESLRLAGFYGQDNQYYGIESTVKRLSERDPDAFRSLDFIPVKINNNLIRAEILKADADAEARPVLKKIGYSMLVPETIVVPRYFVASNTSKGASEGFWEVPGEDVPNDSPLELFVHPILLNEITGELDRFHFRVSEGRSGAAVSQFHRTKAEAIAEALRNVGNVAKTNNVIKEQIDGLSDPLNRTKLSPRYGGTGRNLGKGNFKKSGDDSAVLAAAGKPQTVAALHLYLKHHPFVEVEFNDGRREAREFVSGNNSRMVFKNAKGHGTTVSATPSAYRFYTDRFEVMDSGVSLIYHYSTKEALQPAIDAGEKAAAAEKAEKQAADAAKAAEKERARVARVEGIIARIKNDEMVSGDELVDAARHLGIEVHIRTIGMLRERVKSINSGQAKITGERSIGNSGYELYSAVRGKAGGAAVTAPATAVADTPVASQIARLRAGERLKMSFDEMNALEVAFGDDPDWNNLASVRDQSKTLDAAELYTVFLKQNVADQIKNYESNLDAPISRIITCEMSPKAAQKFIEDSAWQNDNYEMLLERIGVPKEEYENEDNNSIREAAARLVAERIRNCWSPSKAIDFSKAAVPAAPAPSVVAAPILAPTAPTPAAQIASNIEANQRNDAFHEAATLGSIVKQGLLMDRGKQKSVVQWRGDQIAVYDSVVDAEADLRRRGFGKLHEIGGWTEWKFGAESQPEGKPAWWPLWHPGTNPAVDVVVLRDLDSAGTPRKVLLIKRGKEPFKGAYALPGGFVETRAKRDEPWEEGKETAEQAAPRELREETGLNVQLDYTIPGAQPGGNTPTGAYWLERVGVYGQRGRDPRDSDDAQVVSTAFRLILPNDHPHKLKAGDDAKTAEWVDIEKVRKGEIPMAFDHARILDDAFGIRLPEPAAAGTAAPKKEPEIIPELLAMMPREVKFIPPEFAAAPAVPAAAPAAAPLVTPEQADKDTAKAIHAAQMQGCAIPAVPPTLFETSQGRPQLFGPAGKPKRGGVMQPLTLRMSETKMLLALRDSMPPDVPALTTLIADSFAAAEVMRKFRKSSFSRYYYFVGMAAVGRLNQVDPNHPDVAKWLPFVKAVKCEGCAPGTPEPEPPASPAKKE